MIFTRGGTKYIMLIIDFILFNVVASPGYVVAIWTRIFLNNPPNVRNTINFKYTRIFPTYILNKSSNTPNILNI